jgi:replicative DNA helicase
VPSVLTEAKTLGEADDLLQPKFFALMQQYRGVYAVNCALVRDCIQDLEAELRQPDRGVMTGLTDLDQMLGGLRNGSLNVVGARTALGKTTLAVWISLHVARTTGPVVYFSREIDKKSLALKSLSATSGINCFSGAAQQQFQKLQTDWESLAKVPLYLDDSPRLTVADISSRLRQIARSHGGQLSLVVVDYIQLMVTSPTDQVAELDAITVELRAIAREFNLPVLALAQINRGVESRTNKRPTLADIRSSGAIEQNSDVVIGIYREDYYDPNTVNKDITELIVLKNRYGPTGTVKVLHQLHYGGYLNLLRSSL